MRGCPAGYRLRSFSMLGLVGEQAAKVCWGRSLAVTLRMMNPCEMPQVMATERGHKARMSKELCFCFICHPPLPALRKKFSAAFIKQDGTGYSTRGPMENSASLWAGFPGWIGNISLATACEKAGHAPEDGGHGWATLPETIITAHSLGDGPGHPQHYRRPIAAFLAAGPFTRK